MLDVWIGILYILDWSMWWEFLRSLEEINETRNWRIEVLRVWEEVWDRGLLMVQIEEDNVSKGSNAMKDY